MGEDVSCMGISVSSLKYNEKPTELHGVPQRGERRTRLGFYSFDICFYLLAKNLRIQTELMKCGKKNRREKKKGIKMQTKGEGCG